MAKKKKQKKKLTKTWNPFSNQSGVVRSAIGGVTAAAVAGFLALAASGSAGVVGATIYGWLSAGIGAGYWILILGLLVIAYGLLSRAAELPTITWRHTTAAVVLFLMILALISVAGGSGGLVGSLIASGVIGAFSIYAGTIILEVVAIVALLILVDEYADLNQVITWGGLAGASWLGADKKADTADEPTVTTAKDKNAPPEEKPANTPTETKTKKSGKEPDATKAEDSSDSDEYDIAGYNKDGGPLTSVPEGTFGDYTPPPVSLLSRDAGDPEVGDVKARANLIKRTLENFNIDVAMDEVSIGPTVTRYALKPAEGVRLNKITNLQNNLELALAAHPVRIEAPIPGKSLVGIEVPNTSKTTVGLAGLLGSKRFQDDEAALLMGLGQGISGESYFADLNKMPHLLIGGATGAGKSVTAHVLINSLLFRNSPKNLKLILVDPKRVELTLYNGIPHLLTPVITSAKKAILAMKWAAKEMDRRYDILEEQGARDIASYHEKLPKLKKQRADDEPSPDPMPYIVVVFDEMSDLMSAYPKELEAVIVRIAQMSRAVGIHLILSTQRPEVSVITGIIKANVPARIALQVSSQIDSRTILDSKGAEQLLGAGDMLYQSGDMSKPVRIQSAFISEQEVKKVVKHLKDQYADQLQDTVNLAKDRDGDGGKTIFDVAKEAEEEEDRDNKYKEALETVIDADKASTSYLQRKLRVGYSRAARIMDELEENNIISAKDGTKARDVLVTRADLEAARRGGAEASKPDDQTTESGDPEESGDEDDSGEGEQVATQ
jgi:S-DNA-T family DNA segregation ATPase FtsK/SpoIIIE